MDSETRTMLAVAAMCCLVAVTGIGGCTAYIMQSNTQYYEMVDRCIAAGGTFIPTAGGNSNAACIKASTP